MNQQTVQVGRVQRNDTEKIRLMPNGQKSLREFGLFLSVRKGDFNSREIEED